MTPALAEVIKFPPLREMLISSGNGDLFATRVKHVQDVLRRANGPVLRDTGRDVGAQPTLGCLTRTGIPGHGFSPST